MQVGCEKSFFFENFDQYLASSHIVDGITIRYCKQSAAGPWYIDDTRHWKQ